MRNIILFWGIDVMTLRIILFLESPDSNLLEKNEHIKSSKFGVKYTMLKEQKRSNHHVKLDYICILMNDRK